MLRVSIILIPVVIFINVLPLVAALSQDSDYANFQCVTKEEERNKREKVLLRSSLRAEK